ncbi:MAG: M1 family metallopeptidase [Saprospiraceae bacterium]
MLGGPHSPRNASYEMDVLLDQQQKILTADQKITWINLSPDTIYELRLYMYVNAFKNNQSTFLKDVDNIFGNPFLKRKEEEWGWIEMNEIFKGDEDLTSNLKYIQPDDGNEKDQTVLSVPLKNPILPGDTAIFDGNFTVKIPRLFVRVGYEKNDFYMLTHWFPQVGVYEKDKSGNWGWNCHQFFRGTEFFSDFGTYKVSITTTDNLVLGGSGCILEEVSNGGKKTTTFYAEDVIDFAWTAYPDYEVVEDHWNHVSIRMLVPPEHQSLAPRLIGAVKNAFEYLDKHVGPYPYNTLTMVDPPFHGLRGGFMEYPTFITGGSFYHMPEGIKSIESLMVHEFCHQYFMGMLASNEKEEAWLDEGFVTFFEDEITNTYNTPKNSLIDFAGLHIGNAEMSRLEYTGMSNPSLGKTARPGWEFTGGYKPLVYAKTGTMLQTLRNIVGVETFDAILKAYFKKWKFKHPKEADFRAVADSVVIAQHGNMYGENLDWYFDPLLHGTEVCDYGIVAIENIGSLPQVGIFDKGDSKQFFAKEEQEPPFSNVIVERKGGLIFPMELLVTFEDGSTKVLNWDGKSREHVFKIPTSVPIRSAHLDPKQKIYLDLDLNNNSLTLEKEKSAMEKYAAKFVFWLQQILLSLSWLV